SGPGRPSAVPLRTVARHAARADFHKAPLGSWYWPRSLARPPSGPMVWLKYYIAVEAGLKGISGYFAPAAAYQLAAVRAILCKRLKTSSTRTSALVGEISAARSAAAPC